MSELYRPGKLGESLVDALDTLIKEGKITEGLAVQVMAEFDRSMARAFNTQVTAKATLKGKLDVYRYFDNVWTFVLSDPVLRVAPTMNSTKREEEEVEAEGPLKLVLVDTKVVNYTGEDDAPGGEGGSTHKAEKG